MLLFLKSFTKEDALPLNVCFLSNSVSNALLLPLLILFFLNETLTQNNVLFLGVLLFWASSAFYFLSIFFVKRLNLKATIYLSFLFKVISLFVLLFNQSFYVCVFAICLNAFGKSLFSMASKLYIKKVSSDVSKSFSYRFTIQNIGASISPLIVISIVYLALPFSLSVLILLIIFTISTFYVSRLSKLKASFEASYSIKNINKKLYAFVALVCVAFSIFYYLFETGIPLTLVNLGQQELLGPLLLINTLLIIFLQIPVYGYVNKKLGELAGLFVAFLICLALFSPLLFGVLQEVNIYLAVLGITYLEMFFATALDTIIVKNSNDSDSSNLFILSSLMLSVGASISGYIYVDDSLYLFYISVCLLLLCGLFSYLLSRTSKKQYSENASLEQTQFP